MSTSISTYILFSILSLTASASPLALPSTSALNSSSIASSITFSSTSLVSGPPFPTFVRSRQQNVTTTPLSALTQAFTSDLGGTATQIASVSPVISDASPIQTIFSDAAPAVTSIVSGVESTDASPVDSPAPTSAGGFSFPTIDPAVMSLVEFQAKSLAAQVTIRSGVFDFSVPVSTATVKTVAPTAVSAAAVAASSAIAPAAAVAPATVTETPLDPISLVDTLLGQVNKYVNKLPAEVRPQVPPMNEVVWDATSCPAVIDYVHGRVNSATTQTNGTMNSTSSSDLHFTGTTAGTLVVKNSNIQLVAHNSTLTFQFTAPFMGCEPRVLHGNASAQMRRDDGGNWGWPPPNCFVFLCF